jgi:hypothetical protein
MGAGMNNPARIAEPVSACASFIAMCGPGSRSQRHYSRYEIVRLERHVRGAIQAAIGHKASLPEKKKQQGMKP